MAQDTAVCITAHALPEIVGHAWTEERGAGYRIVWQPKNPLTEPDIFAWLDLSKPEPHVYDFTSGEHADPYLDEVAWRCAASSL